MSYNPNLPVNVSFTVNRNSSIDIPVPEYDRLKPFSRHHEVCLGKDTHSYDIVFTSAGYISIDKSENHAEAIWIADPFSIAGVVADRNANHFAVIHRSGKETQVPFEALLPKTICNALFTKNIAVNSRGKANEAFSEYLQNVLQDFPVLGVQKILGWNMIDGTLVWQGANMNPPLLDYQNSFGSDDKYLQHLNLITDGCSNMQFVLCTAAASTILAYLGLILKIPVDSFGLSLVGDSSTGKTSALRLAASLYGSTESEYLFSSFNGTENALLYILGSHRGVPLCYDEATIDRNLKKSDFIYSFSEGVSKLRLNQQCQLQERITWLCTCLFSSENRLVDLTKGDKKGTAVRILCLEDKTYTRDSTHSDEIKTFAAQNQGVIGKLLSDYLMSAEPENVHSWYEDARQNLMHDKRLISCPLTNRLISNHGMILCAARAMQQIGVTIDIDALTAISIEMMNQVSEQVDTGKYLIQKIFSFIISDSSVRQGILWDAFPNGTPRVCAITETTLSTILVKCGVKDVRTAIRSMDKTGCIIRPETNRIKATLSIDGHPCGGYRFDMQKVNEQFDTDHPIFYTKKKIRKVYNHDDGSLDEYEDVSEMLINPIAFENRNFNHQFEGKLLLL